MSRRLYTIVAGAIGFLAAPCISQANLIINGSFETFATSGTGISNFGVFFTYQVGAIGLTGWSILTKSIDINSTGWWQQAPGGGSNGLDLMGSDAVSPASTIPQYGGVSQVVTGLIPGTSYQLGFWHSVNAAGDFGAANPSPGIPDFQKPRTLDVVVFDDLSNTIPLSASGSGVVLPTNHAQYTLLTGTRTLTNMQWLQDSVSFVAPSSSVTVQFSTAQFSDPALSLCRSGPALDNVTLNEVPEPTSLALLAPAISLLLCRSRRPIAVINN